MRGEKIGCYWCENRTGLQCSKDSSGYVAGYPTHSVKCVKDLLAIKEDKNPHNVGLPYGCLCANFSNNKIDEKEKVSFT